MDANIVSLDAQSTVLIRLAKLLPLIRRTSQFSSSFVSVSTQLRLKVTFQTEMNPSFERGWLRRMETTFWVPHKFTTFCLAHNLGSQTPQFAAELKILTIH